ncbi:MAG: nucleoside-diphosphate sugar epimerase/dehydratase [Anaerolineae bacterium]
MALVQQIRNRYLFFLDVVLLIAAVYLSYILRLETFKFGQMWSGFAFYSLLAVTIIPLIFYVFGIYARYWVYASVEEMTLLATAVTIGAAIAGGLGLIVLRLLPVGTLNLPRSIPFIFFPIALCVTAGPRFAMRIYAQYARRHSDPHNRRQAAKSQTVLIMGAGEAGMLIVRELQRSPSLNMDVVGFVDDDPRKRSARILGVPVLGNRRAIPQLVSSYNIDLVIIAMPTTAGREIREIVHICEQAGVKTKIMPGIYEVLNGTVSINQLRSVQIEDLLRREPVNVDNLAVRGLLSGKRVMVTGGGGSIGSELCRQILRCRPSELLVLGHGENSIFEICNELQRQIKLESSQFDDGEQLPIIRPVIADIRFSKRIESIFQQYRPQVVFHAAAHKHVPLMEDNPTEAVSNNVLGTRNLLMAAVAVDTERFVMISTDKAVKPTSIMGASKRVAELLVHQTAQQVKKPYVAVRFGNVLGSRGSVVLTFKQQIAAGGPVTVTHPEMKRFFMTIPEAVQLVLQAAVLGQGGEVFMLDMGEPVKIVDLAQDLIALSGLEVGRDIDIVYTGMRPGEKMYEELFIPGEVYQRTAHQKIFVIGNANGFVPVRIDHTVEQLEAAVEQDNAQVLLNTLTELLPRYHPWLTAEATPLPGTLPINLDSAPASSPAPNGEH